MIDIKKIFVLFTALLLGFFVVVQSRSFESVNDLFFRDIQSNIFQEIRILKEKKRRFEEGN